MELLQDGVIAALAAIGVTALIWLAASLLLWRERPVDAVYLVRVSGDGTGLDVTLRRLAQSRRLPVLPMWMARAAAPLMAGIARRRKQRPLYTRYSLYTLNSNDRFSHDKATRELGYHPRDLYQTVRDTVVWMLRQPAASAG